MESEKCRDEIRAKNEEEALSKAIRMHNGIKPASLSSIVKKE